MKRRPILNSITWTYFAGVFNTMVMFFSGVVLAAVAFFAIWALCATYKDKNKIHDLCERVKQLQDAEFQKLSEKGQPNGYAPLDGNATVPEEFLPSINTTTQFLGCWDASTNTPVVISGIGKNGQFYIVCTPGSANVDGITDWDEGDILIFEGNISQWLKNDGSPEDLSQLNTTLVTETFSGTRNATFSNVIQDSTVSASYSVLDSQIVNVSCPEPNSLIDCECYWVTTQSDTDTGWIEPNGGLIFVGTEIPFVPDRCECNFQILAHTGAVEFGFNLTAQVTCVL